MKPRPLTSGEISLARTVFGDSIDYASVSVSEEKYIFFQPSGTAMAPNGNLYMHGCYCDDYAAGDALTRGFFIHEMTHVWQFQNKILDPVKAAFELSLKHKFNYLASYDFILDEKKDLVDYGMEQQASIVQAYYMMVHGGAGGYTGNCMNQCTDDERLGLCEKVLRNFLADPAYARQGKFPGKGKKPRP